MQSADSATLTELSRAVSQLSLALEQSERRRRANSRWGGLALILVLIMSVALGGRAVDEVQAQSESELGAIARALDTITLHMANMSSEVSAVTGELRAIRSDLNGAVEMSRSAAPLTSTPALQRVAEQESAASRSELSQFIAEELTKAEALLRHSLAEERAAVAAAKQQAEAAYKHLSDPAAKATAQQSLPAVSPEVAKRLRAEIAGGEVDPALLGMVHSMREMTKAQRALQQAEARLRASPDCGLFCRVGLFIENVDGLVTNLNHLTQGLGEGSAAAEQAMQEMAPETLLLNQQLTQVAALMSEAQQVQDPTRRSQLRREAIAQARKAYGPWELALQEQTRNLAASNPLGLAIFQGGLTLNDATALVLRLKQDSDILRGYQGLAGGVGLIDVAGEIDQLGDVMAGVHHEIQLINQVLVTVGYSIGSTMGRIGSMMPW